MGGGDWSQQQLVVPSEVRHMASHVRIYLLSRQLRLTFAFDRVFQKLSGAFWAR